MCRASRALAASIAAFGLSACQLLELPEQTVEKTETVPVTVVSADAPNDGPAMVPVSLSIDDEVDLENVEIKTITLIEVEERPSQILQALAKFTAKPESQRRSIKRYRENYRAAPNQNNALQLGLALAVSGTDDNVLNYALGLLDRVDIGHPDHALAVLVMDQTRKQLSLLNIEAAPVAKPADTSAPVGAGELSKREQALRQREVELLERERSVANERGENFRLRQQLARAEQKLRELAQIEDDLSRPSPTPQP